jgi:hypothetical protein
VAKLTQDDIQPVMDLLDLLRDVRTALADFDGGEWEASETANVDVSDKAGRAVTIVRNLPLHVVRNALVLMEKEVQALLQARDIQVVEAA